MLLYSASASLAASFAVYLQIRPLLLNKIGFLCVLAEQAERLSVYLLKLSGRCLRPTLSNHTAALFLHILRNGHLIAIRTLFKAVNDALAFGFASVLA